MELSVANATAAFEMVLSPGAGIASAAGKKETKGFLMQGASPLAFPGLGGARHGLNLRSRHPAGGYPRRWRLDQPLRCPAGACSAGCLLTLPLVYFVSPIPPPPPSRRGRGRPRLFHARGFAPCIPGAGREAALAFLVENGFLWLSQRCKGIQSLAGWDAALVNSAASQGEGGPGERNFGV